MNSLVVVAARQPRQWASVLAFFALILCSAPAWAQTSAGIAGTVKDTTGAVLPGVTVEAASPALIERVRSVVTDDKGEYKIVDLRSGIYSVTATLTGFNTYKREGIELSAGFTATVNAELKVGALQETVTVTGASPVVDTQNSRTQQVLKTETLNELPGARSLTAFAAMTLGAVASTAGRNDVGGDKGDNSTGIILHGGRGDDGRTNWDGMNTNVFFGNAGGQQRVYLFNTVGVQEIVVDTGGNAAEIETGGANVNMVPKDGGNRFSANGTANFANNSFSASSIPSDLTARGGVPTASVKDIWDYGIGVGGPIVKDRVWFFTANRWWGSQNLAPGAYFNKSPNFYQYIPDTSHPAFHNDFFVDNAVRLTIQGTSKQKFTAEYHLQHGCQCYDSVSAFLSPEANEDFTYGPQSLVQGTWSYARSGRLLFQAGATFLFQGVNFTNGYGSNPNYFTGIGQAVYPDAAHVPIKDNLTQVAWNGLAGGTGSYGPGDNSNNFNQQFSMSYVTGSHAVKVGLQTLQGQYDTYGMQNGVNEFNYQFYGGVPTTIVQFAGPFETKDRVSSQGVFAQDQWTLNRLTLNLGARFDRYEGHTLPLSLPAGPFIAARQTSEVDKVPDFKDITPRLGASYDVFGNGKTAIKVAWGRYLYGQGGGAARNVDPSTAITTQASRSWNDANHNYVPDCNLANFTANGECGALNNTNFGQSTPLLSYSPNASQGWFNREYNYQTSIQLQQELRPGVGLAVGYFHTSWGNLTVIQNLTDPTAANFNNLCVTAPSDPLLGSVSGQQVCGYYAPKTFAAPTYQIGKATDLGLGTPTESYNGVDIGFNARWGKGALVQGGVSIGRETVDFCYANGHPELSPANIPGVFIYGGAIYGFPVYPQGTTNGTSYCHITSSWWDGIGSQAKLQAVYPLPLDFQVSGTFKTLPGIPITATQYSFQPQGATLQYGFLPAALIPNAAAGAAIGTQFDSRLYETDLRLTKAIKRGSTRILGIVDLYNAFNNRVSQANLGTIGTPGAFLTPTQLLGGRLLKLGAQVTF